MHTKNGIVAIVLVLSAVLVSACGDGSPSAPSPNPSSVSSSSPSPSLSLVPDLSRVVEVGKPENATGTYQIVGRNILSMRDLPNACFIEMNLTIQFDGTFEGLLNANLTLFSRGACAEQGTADELHGQGTFAGTVQDADGTLRVEFRGRHSAEGIAEARIVALNGDGGLSSLHAVLWGIGIQGVGGTYEGRIHFDP